MLIAIDAGHGLYTAGKRIPKQLDPNQTREWTLNSNVASMLQIMLEKYEVETFRTDDKTGEVDIPLENRVKNANNKKADVLISIHHNAGAKLSDSGGAVVFVARNASEESKQLQSFVYDHLIYDMPYLAGNRAEPTPEKSFYIIRYTKMPAILIECAFMDSTVDINYIQDESFAMNVARSLCDSLVEFYDLKEADRVVENTDTPSDFAKQAVEWCKENGISTSERPHDNVTREELMLMLYNFHNKFIDKE